MKSKKFFVLLGILAMALVFGFVLAGCATTAESETPPTTVGSGTGNGASPTPEAEQLAADEVEPYSEPKSIKITGYSSQNITAHTMFVYSESAGTESWPPTAYAIEEINGQTITYPLAIWDYPDWNDPKSEPWTGTGKFFIVIECDPPKDSSKDGAKYVYSMDGINPTPVDINSAITTLEWSDFVWRSDYTAG